MNYSELFFEKGKGADMDFFVDLISRFQMHGVDYELKDCPATNCIRLLIKK